MGQKQNKNFTDIDEVLFDKLQELLKDVVSNPILFWVKYDRINSQIGEYFNKEINDLIVDFSYGKKADSIVNRLYFYSGFFSKLDDFINKLISYLVFSNPDFVIKNIINFYINKHSGTSGKNKIIRLLDDIKKIIFDIKTINTCKNLNIDITDCNKEDFIVSKDFSRCLGKKLEQLVMLGSEKNAEEILLLSRYLVILYRDLKKGLVNSYSKIKNKDIYLYDKNEIGYDVVQHIFSKIYKAYKNGKDIKNKKIILIGNKIIDGLFDVENSYPVYKIDSYQFGSQKLQTLKKYFKLQKDIKDLGKLSDYLVYKTIEGSDELKTMFNDIIYINKQNQNYYNSSFFSLIQREKFEDAKKRYLSNDLMYIKLRQFIQLLKGISNSIWYPFISLFFVKILKNNTFLNQEKNQRKLFFVLKFFIAKNKDEFDAVQDIESLFLLCKKKLVNLLLILVTLFFMWLIYIIPWYLGIIIFVGYLYLLIAVNWSAQRQNIFFLDKFLKYFYKLLLLISLFMFVGHISKLDSNYIDNIKSLTYHTFALDFAGVKQDYIKLGEKFGTDRKVKEFAMNKISNVKEFVMNKISNMFDSTYTAIINFSKK